MSEQNNYKSVGWQANKAVAIAAVIVLLIGLYLIWQQVTQKPPDKIYQFICIRPDGTLERFTGRRNSKWMQEVWKGHGIGPGPCPEGEGEAYVAAVCPTCGHTFLDRPFLSHLPDELTHSSCPNCARLKAQMAEEEKEIKTEGDSSPSPD
ncbi:MAG: hypothetical protein AMS15_06255 [Planctomycetes bacterium DG_23]|nr:MAG: hypothetical protein AMS15_06255 [Planctomycetes bacterium DG_23]